MEAKHRGLVHSPERCTRNLYKQAVGPADRPSPVANHEDSGLDLLIQDIARQLCGEMGDWRRQCLDLIIFRQLFTRQFPASIKKGGLIIASKAHDHAQLFPAAQESRTHTIGDYANASDAGLRLKNRPPIFVLNPSKRHLTCGSASAFKQLPSSVPVPPGVSPCPLVCRIFKASKVSAGLP